MKPGSNAGFGAASRGGSRFPGLIRDRRRHLCRPTPRFLKGWEQRPAEVNRMTQERLLRPREVARQLAVSRSTVYRWFWEGKLQGVKLSGGTVRILESAVLRKLAEAD